MTNQNVPQIIRFGFLEVKLEQSYPVKPKFYSKGKLLYESECVHKSEELKLGDESVIRGIVERQTNKSLPPYKVELHVNGSRILQRASCECASGVSGTCKHVSALIYRINNDSSETKTSVAREWGIPNVAKAIQEKYSKGKRIADLFGKKTIESKNRRNRKRILADKNDNSNNNNNKKMEPVKVKKLVDKKRIYEPVKLNPEMFANVPSAIKLFVEAESKAEQEKLAEIDSRSKADKEIEEVRLDRLNFIIKEIFPTNHSIISNGIIFKDLFHAIIYNENITVDEEAAESICKETVSQSNCKTWFNLRDHRISATKAHKIKIRRAEITENFLDSLMSRVKLKGKALENVQYGKDKEKIALEVFRMTSGLDVYEVGLIISIHQPWLCGSPDGIVMHNGRPQLLEIKCPSSCQGKSIVGEDGTPNVDYLKFVQGRIQLRESHAYYTQVQTLMYLINADYCFFYVYSPKKSAVTVVARNDGFLNKVIIKLEEFYFNHYLPKLCDKRFK